jgi:peptide/nickel transport system permease protein
LRAPVSDLIAARAPTTIELTLYTMLFYMPVGIASGIIASRRRNRAPDHVFRLSAFTATSVPAFILGLMLLSLLYVGLGWGGIGRVSDPVQRIINSPDFKVYTGLYTIDGLINGRLNVTLDALQHLVMPVLALSALHWATVGRVTRTVMIDELDKPYIIAAEARGIPDRQIYWKHAARNALVPALTSSVLGAASLLTGVYVIERVFNLHGVSELIVATGVAALADAPLAMGFALYSVIVVLIVMVVLDIAQAIVDPRMRERLTQ